MGTATTDDLGLFRAVDLQPGEYVVRATPTGPFQQPDRARPAGAGQFKIERLPPTDYLAIAVAGLPENGWVDLYVLSRLWAAATPFHLDEGEQQVLQLELSPHPGRADNPLAVVGWQALNPAPGGVDRLMVI